MTEKRLKVKVFRYNPEVDKEPYYRDYEIPHEKGMSAMDALDYIYQNLDSTIAYYDHAGCSLGICAKCTGRINGVAGLLCQTEIFDETVLEPTNKERVLKDLVMKRDQ
ncbi:MAG: hypothetical protein JW984_09180 [Deltaproteobacteria bacterium]|uniref:Succinate dehydogenase/fumarate reductase N-terminal domain-containing protein n=1 Tax=Candidatus Zymogenus saltonus TaxID=2844893 RepID=A0A9D8KF35_9DELT|nr:hypothetical protein [Candidatus Zymogenus saltonus]